MTAPTPAALDAKPGVYLLLKRGLYYRPGSCGYTGIRDHAGQYTREEAEVRVSVDDGITMIAFDDATEVTSACWSEVSAEYYRELTSSLRARARASDTARASAETALAEAREALTKIEARVYGSAVNLGADIVNLARAALEQKP